MATITCNNTNLKIEIRRDPLNWVVLYGNPNLQNFHKHAEYWYFSTLESMLLRLFALLRDRDLGTLDLDGIRAANASAINQITQIAKNLEVLFAESLNKDNCNG